MRVHHLPLILSHRARVLEHGGTVNAAHDHAAALEDFSVDAARLALVVNKRFLDGALGLRFIHGNKPCRSQLVVP